MLRCRRHSRCRHAAPRYIFQNRSELLPDKVFAGLVMVIPIGLAVESLAFQTLERLKVRRWARGAERFKNRITASDAGRTFAARNSKVAYPGLLPIDRT